MRRGTGVAGERDAAGVGLSPVAVAGEETLQRHGSASAALRPHHLVHGVEPHGERDMALRAHRRPPGALMFVVTNIIIFILSKRLMCLRDRAAIRIKTGDQDSYDKIVSH